MFSLGTEKIDSGGVATGSHVTARVNAAVPQLVISARYTAFY